MYNLNRTQSFDVFNSLVTVLFRRLLHFQIGSTELIGRIYTLTPLRTAWNRVQVLVFCKEILNDSYFCCIIFTFIQLLCKCVGWKRQEDTTLRSLPHGFLLTLSCVMTIHHGNVLRRVVTFQAVLWSLLFSWHTLTTSPHLCCNQGGEFLW